MAPFHREAEGEGSDPAQQGIGARLLRKEDDRFMRGRGEYVGDIRLPGMQEAAFLRSPLAHARIAAIRIPPALRDRVFIAEDLAGVAPIRADTALPGFKSSVQPVLATGKVRYVGELVALLVAPTRAEAEDLAAEINVDFEPLPVVHDMLQGRRPAAPLVHEHWGDNLFLTTATDVDFEAVKAKSAVSVTRELRTARQAMCPLEGRGVVASWNTRLGQLVVYSSTQQPHIVRSGLAECLGLDEGAIRVVAPDVGGGFGYKGILLPEEIALAWATRRLGHPLRWLEDRREGLGNANCREHHYLLTAYADAEGRLLALDCEATVNSGAYSAYPFSACLEAGQIGSILPGLYDFPHYRCRTWSVATNKPPILPYRGVARTGVCFALEVTLEALARKLGIEPTTLRFNSLVRPEQMPFDNIARRHFDSGDYPEALRRAVDAIGLEGVRARQVEGEPDGRRIGVGFAMYSEQAGHGTSVYAAWGIPFVPGYEQCQARFTPDGALELRIGAHSHGQGMETTLSQVAHSILGVPHERIRLVHGDTAATPYSTGTWGSRCMIMAGGAVATACEMLADRVLEIGSRLLQARREDVRIESGEVVGPSGRLSVAEVARTWYRRPQDLPSDVDPGGLELTAGYKAGRDTGTFSYAAHAATVAVDIDDGGGRDPRLRGGGGRRRAGEPHDRGRPDPGRHGAGHRHRALRGDALRRPGPAARRHPVRLPAAGSRGGPGSPHPAHGDAVALHPLRPEGDRRGRHHCAARCHHQRHQRCAGRPGRRAPGLPGHAAAHRRGDRACGVLATRHPGSRAAGEAIRDLVDELDASREVPDRSAARLRLASRRPG